MALRFGIGRADQQLILPQAYLKGHWHQLELQAGCRKYTVGLVDTLLTSEAYAMLGNAFQYWFLIEFDEHIAEASVQQIVQHHSAEIKWLGSYKNSGAVFSY